jgi:hypothetical protein
MFEQQKEAELSIPAFVALGIVAVTSVVLWLSGSRFTKAYVARYGRMPPLTWMFHRTDDPELEGHRRTALALLPLYLVGAIVYLAATGPLA